MRVDNETANVYSALIGFVPMLILLCNAWAIRSSNWSPIGVSIGILLFCVNIAMTSAYHTYEFFLFGTHSFPHPNRLFSVGSAKFLVFTQFGQRLIMLVSTLHCVRSRSLWATTVINLSIVGCGIKSLRSWPYSLFRLASLPQVICCSQTMIRKTTSFSA